MVLSRIAAGVPFEKSFRSFLENASRCSFENPVRMFLSKPSKSLRVLFTTFYENYSKNSFENFSSNIYEKEYIQKSPFKDFFGFFLEVSLKILLEFFEEFLQVFRSFLFSFF